MKIWKKSLVILITMSVTLSSSLATADDNEPKDVSNDSLINDWGNSALTFTVLKKNYDLEALGFPPSNDNISSLSTNFQLHQVKTIFDNKDFNAKSVFSQKTVNQNDDKKFFLQGNYKILKQEKFSLLLTAKIESLSEHSIYQFYSNDFVSRPFALKNTMSYNSYAKLGIIGQYSINEHWYLVGGITSTAHENSVNNQAIYTKKVEQTALIGTTYTF
jgi:hypothetical protein